MEYAFYKLLPQWVRCQIGELPDDLTELRLRAGKSAELVCRHSSQLRGEAMSAERIAEAADSLAAHSLYAREEELKQGFFTVEGGCRVGVCGRMTQHMMTHISSVCIRAAREIIGAADEAMKAVWQDGRVFSTLVISPPGMGKTTLLRDLVRQLSDQGVRAAVADERGEIAGCVLGVPQLDVGVRSDVLDGCARHKAIRLLIRAMSPQLIVTDEIGGAEDAAAILDALRCGVRVIASAHADDIHSAALRCGVLTEYFERLIVLGGSPGRIQQIFCAQTGEKGERIWKLL